MFMSVMTISNLPRPSFCSASRAEPAVSTSNPFILRIAFRVSRIANSSSTSKMRRFIGISRIFCKAGIQRHNRFRRETRKSFHHRSCGADRERRRPPHPKCRYNTPVGSFFVENFGCRATQADGAAIERQLADQGLSRADTAAEAEVVVLNTCTVTSSADQDARAAIRRIHRLNPGARILVTGCYAQRASEEISAIDGVSLVVGNSHKHQLGELAAANGLRLS